MKSTMAQNLLTALKNAKKSGFIKNIPQIFDYIFLHGYIDMSESEGYKHKKKSYRSLLMTTKASENLYLAQHLHSVEGKNHAIFNPHEKPITDLPKIYGFNNGGSPGWYNGVLLSEDGVCLGGHVCSHEGYMEHDLGILQGSREDRHIRFKEHYPDGYIMDFIGINDAKDHEGLNKSIDRYKRNIKNENA